jgi:hypothetical protein
MERKNPIKEVEQAPEVEQTPEVKEAPTPVISDGKIWWKKVGKGSLRWNHKILKPNEKFLARPSEVPKAFRDVVVPLEELKEDDTVPIVEPVKSEYEVRPRGKSKSLFDVVYPAGKDEEGETIWKTINEKPLPKAIAEKMLREISQ